MLLTGLMEQNMAKFGEYPFLYFGDKTYTNKDSFKLAEKIAQVLQSQGIEKGDRVLVCMPNCPEVFFSYQGILRAGGIVIPVMFLLHPQEIQFILANSEAKAVITSSLILPKIIEAAKLLADKPKVLVVDQVPEVDPALGITATNLYQEMDQASSPIREYKMEESDIAVILYTSGTTGKPKGVMLTHKNLYSNAAAAVSLYENEDRGTTLGVLPLAHIYGFTAANSLYLHGDSMVVFPKYDLEQVCQAIQKHKVRSFSAVPAMVYDMVMNPITAKYDLSSLERVVSGSAPLPVTIIEAFKKKFNADILEGYGLSEASPAVSAHRIGMPIKPGSVGVAFPGVEIKIVDADGNELPTGEIGELIVRGDNVTPGYFRNEEATNSTIKEGWLYTGDMAKVDEDGYLFIVDRKKDLIIRGGFNIYPRDLEELIVTHDSVAEVAVVGVPSPQMGEEVVAFVVKKPGKEVSEEELIQFCQDRLAKYKTPRRILFTDHLPRNGVGKILKKQIREMAADLKLFA